MSVPMYQAPLSVNKVELIRVVALRGDGTEGSPVRHVSYYYDDGGEMVACCDPFNGPVDSFVSPRSKG